MQVKFIFLSEKEDAKYEINKSLEDILNNTSVVRYSSASIQDLLTANSRRGSVPYATPQDIRNVKAVAMTTTLETQLLSSLENGFKNISLLDGASLNTTLRYINNTVRSSLNNVLENNIEMVGACQSSDEYRRLKLRIQHKLFEYLLPIYRAFVNQVMINSIEAFESRINKLPNAANLPDIANSLKQSVCTAFSLSCDSLAETFSGLQQIIQKHALFASKTQTTNWATAMNLAAKWGYGTAGPHHFVFDAEVEYRALENYLKRRLTEHVNSLIVSGSFNPYVRTLNFPPTHINMNILVDSVTMLSNREIDHYYDEHKVGACIDRADPVSIPIQKTNKT